MPFNVTTELWSNDSFRLFNSWKHAYLCRKKPCSMTCGAVVDKAVTLHSQLYSCAIKSAWFGETGEKRNPSTITVKPLTTMIAHVAKHVFSRQTYHALKWNDVKSYRSKACVCFMCHYDIAYRVPHTRSANIATKCNFLKGTPTVYPVSLFFSICNHHKRFHA